MTKIYSMTAFARYEHKEAPCQLTWEIRAVNHRYLEIQPKLPEAFRDLEPALRETIKKHVARGKLEVGLRYQLDNNQETVLAINKELTQSLFSAFDQLDHIAASSNKANKSALTAPNKLELLAWPGVLEQEQSDLSQIKPQALATLEKALEQFNACRQREGGELKDFLLSHLDNMGPLINQISELAPKNLEQMRTKMNERLAEINHDTNPERLEQELLFWAQKLEITEEIERLQTHIKETRRALNQGGVTGRRLDFLMQELNRECNTLGSKSQNSTATQAVVELKVIVEKMREQIQNIE
ncbi:YicC/YloC family endoribonuclease [Piscirickettsia litoralis]|uniref:YicC family protein n=1 Tax=Piscirickettsia litoralis TaxID=1891921 RepID=A0ABX3A0E7_9GAMM|nr:YicC/YloC family endoribonuclease [Piscirickettsia litoralis]ODN42334.1 YicC family protein [Piscirickettsia litoralis]